MHNISLDRVSLISPLSVLIDRGLQQAGLKPTFEEHRDSGAPEYFHWLFHLRRVDEFLAANNMVLFLVLDDIDEIFKLSDSLSREVHESQAKLGSVSLWMTSSEPYLRALLFRSRTSKSLLNALGYEGDIGQWNSQKVIETCRLMPIQSRERHAEAIEQLFTGRPVPANRQALVDAANRYRADPTDALARLELVDEILSTGSVPSALVGSESKRSLSRGQMVEDLEIAPAKALAEIIKAHAPGVSLATVGYPLAQARPSRRKNGPPKLTRWDPGLPSFKEGEFFSHLATGSTRGDVGNIHRVLRSLADSGVIVPGQFENWEFASWSAVAAVLERVK